MASSKSDLSSLLENFSILGQDKLERRLEEAKWSSFSSLEFPFYNFSSLNWMNQMKVHQTENRRIEEKNDADGHFMEFLIHDQMDHFKPFTWSEKSRMKCLDEFYVEEGNGNFSASLAVNNSRNIEPVPYYVPKEYDYDGNLVGLGGGPYYTGYIGITNDDGHVINSMKTILQNFMKLIPPTLSGPEKSKILLRSFANIKFQITEAHTKYCQESAVYLELVQFDDWMNKIIESSKLVCATQSIELKDDVKKLQDITEKPKCTII